MEQQILEPPISRRDPRVVATWMGAAIVLACGMWLYAQGGTAGFHSRTRAGALLIELWRVLIQIAITEGGELFGRAEFQVFTAAIRTARQRLRECAGARPDAQSLHRIGQKSLFVGAACLLDELQGSNFIAFDQPLLKCGHDLFSIYYPIKTMQLYGHKLLVRSAPENISDFTCQIARYVL